MTGPRGTVMIIRVHPLVAAHCSWSNHMMWNIQKYLSYSTTY
uniref:Uncharacterized protein n=2 Tax=Anguilla anguilla TaxID=7936 RepID=A0A0E9T043_ANGAN